MNTEKKQMRCGACGGDSFQISTTDQSINLFVLCIKCESSTVLTVQPAALSFDWGENSEGIICPF